MFKHLFLIILPFLVLACAQTKTLSGGPQDVIAPIPLAMIPKNESTHFNSKRIVIAFDEYIKLNNAAQNISIVPNDFKIKTFLKNKSVVMDLEGEFRENTTYSIFINKAIQDIHEGKDSIMQYVFSTGAFIDSLSFECFVLDAVSTQPINGITVGLFDNKDSLKPIYFTQANEGIAKFNYLKEGTYYLRAFEDENRDGKIGKYEKVAFHEKAVSIPQTDTVNLLLFSPELLPDITQFSFNAPGQFNVVANRIISQDSIYLNGTKVDKEKIIWFSQDSLIILDQGIINASNVLLLQNGWIDSAKTRIPNTRTKQFSISTKGLELAPNDSFQITAPGRIFELDTTLLNWTNSKDSSKIVYQYTIEKNTIKFMYSTFEKSKFFLQAHAVKIDSAWKSGLLDVNIIRLQKEDVGTLTIHLDYYKEPIVLEIVKGGKIFKSMYMEEPKSVILEDLIPGEFTFRVILDKNKNKKWDTGSFFDGIQPEEIHLYTSPTKVRGNWEMDVHLEPTNKNEE